MRASIVRLLIRYGLQAVLVLSPLLTMGFSLLNLIGHSAAGPTDAVQVLFLSGPKQEVELRLRVYISVVALFVALTFEAVDLYLPSRSLLRFRKHYLEEQKKEWRARLIDDVRINIMYARRRWYFLWLVTVLEWTWNDGFRPPSWRSLNGFYRARRTSGSSHRSLRSSACNRCFFRMACDSTGKSLLEPA